MAAKRQSVSVIIPTYNERVNITKLIPLIFQSCKGLGVAIEVIVVDDNSPDGTGEAAEELGKRYNVRVIHRPGKLGLASAAIRGFSEAKGEILGLMDADLSHAPSTLPLLIGPILNGDTDVTVGSRYVKGGGVEVWPLHRKLISKVATLLALPLTPVRDPMSGLFFFRRSVIDGISLNAKGYKIGLEIIVKGKYRKISEVPYIFRNRFVGKSKLTAMEYAHYLRNIIVFGAYKLKHGVPRRAYEAISQKKYHDAYSRLDPRIYYDALVKGNSVQSFWHRQKFREVLSEATITPQSVVADIGCGPGLLIYQLPKNKLTVAVDVSEQAVNFATALNRKAGKKVNGVVALAEKLPFRDNTFDCIFMVEVIEHMPPEAEARALKEVRRVLKPGGQFIMTTPNYRSAWPLIEFFWSKMNPVNYLEQHINKKNPATVRKSLTAAGFKVVKIRTFFLASPFIAPLSSGLGRRVSKVENRLLPGLGLLILSKAEKI